MKRTVLLLMMVMFIFSGIYGQTYYFKHVETVDESGEKRKGSKGAYITFADRQKTCYVSDENGYSKTEMSCSSPETYFFSFRQFGSSSTFNYVESRNGTHGYDNSYEMNMVYFTQKRSATAYLYFNTDYNKMILLTISRLYGEERKTQYVFEKTDGPYDENMPIF